MPGNEKLVGRDEEPQALLGFLQARDSLPAILFDLTPEGRPAEWDEQLTYP